MDLKSIDASLAGSSPARGTIDLQYIGILQD